MTEPLTVEYWEDDGWLVGKLKEIPGIFSQGQTLAELKDNLLDAYQVMFDPADKIPHPGSHIDHLAIEA